MFSYSISIPAQLGAAGQEDFTRNFYPERGNNLYSSYDKVKGIGANQDLGMLEYPHGLSFRNINGREMLYDQKSGETYYALAPTRTNSYKRANLVTDEPNGRILVNSNTGELYPESWYFQSDNNAMIERSINYYNEDSVTLNLPAYVRPYFDTSTYNPNTGIAETVLFDTQNQRVIRVIADEKTRGATGDVNYYMIDAQNGRMLTTAINGDGNPYIADFATGTPFEKVPEQMASGNFDFNDFPYPQLEEIVTTNPDKSLVHTYGYSDFAGAFHETASKITDTPETYLYGLTSSSAGYFPSGCLVCAAGIIGTGLLSRYYANKAKKSSDAHPGSYCDVRDKEPKITRKIDKFFAKNAGKTLVCGGILTAVGIGSAIFLRESAAENVKNLSIAALGMTLLGRAKASHKRLLSDTFFEEVKRYSRGN